ncbi:hypothetical protein V8F06_009443 [Rhypophila decipiens]
MQLTNTIITLLSAASVTLAAPTSDSSTYKPKYSPSSNLQYSNEKVNAFQPSVTPVPPTEKSTASAATSNIQALLQLELERQTTFIQRQVPVPGRIALNLDTLFSAFIVSVEDASTGEDVNIVVTCQALDAQGRAVGASIGADAGNADLNGGEPVQIAFVECLEVEASS